MRAPAFTVLLADDDKVQTLMLASILRAKGYRVDTAYDASQAFTTAIRTPPDVVVLDIQMPAGTGMMVLERLKASNRTAHVPVIVLSGSLEPDIDARVRALGAIEFLPKPVDVDQLLAAVSLALGQTPDAAAPPAQPPAGQAPPQLP